MSGPGSRRLAGFFLYPEGAEISQAALDEMLRAAGASERHAVVTPLLVGAGPFRVVPAPTVPVALVREDVVENFGPPDPAYRDLPTALHAYSTRLSRYGYSTVGVGVEPGSVRWSGPSVADARRLRDEFPEYGETVRRGPLPRTAAAVQDGEGRPSILFNCLQVINLHNGTSEYSCSLVGAFHREFGGKYRVAVLIHRGGFDFHRDSLPVGASYLHPDDPSCEGFRADLAVTLTQFFHLDHLARVLPMGDRHVGVVLDAIAWRCNYIHALSPVDIRLLNRVGLGLSDGLITISQSALSDIRAFFPEETASLPAASIHLAAHTRKTAPVTTDWRMLAKYPFLKGRYVLIVGNRFCHKCLPEAVGALKGVDIHKVVVGLVKKTCGRAGGRTTSLPGGSIPEGELDLIYRHAHLVVFPSVYEGFGLPLLKAVQHGRRAVVFDGATSREIAGTHVKNEGQVHFFRRFADLPAIVNALLEDYSLPLAPLRGWDDVARDAEAFFAGTLARPVDGKKARMRESVAELLRQASVCAIAGPSPRPETVSATALLKTAGRWFFWKLSRLFRRGKPWPVFGGCGR